MLSEKTNFSTLIYFFINKRKQVAATRADAEKDGVIVPTTLEDYCVKSSQKEDQNEDCIYDELDDMDPFDNDDDNCDYDDSNTDSGNEDS